MEAFNVLNLIAIKASGRCKTKFWLIKEVHNGRLDTHRLSGGYNLNASIVGRAAISYSALVFAVGFVLGAIRIFVIVPRWGDLLAVILETPIMLLVSWLACGILVRLFNIRGARAGLAMGVSAFVLLMSAELVLSVLAFGRSPSEFVSAYGTPAGAIGLMGQVAFGLMPLFRTGRRRGNL